MTPSFARVALVALTLFFLPALQPHAFAHTRPAGPAHADLRAVEHASMMAGTSPSRAVTWLRRRTHGTRITMSPDGTILVQFHNGGQIAIVGRRTTTLTPSNPAHRMRATLRARQAAGANRALVLEPFADELGLGPNAGAPEIDALTHAGYAVDVKRNAEVTVPVMETLSNYSAVYMETHSGLLPDGDGIIVTGETNFGAYGALAPVQYGGDGSLMQAFVAGDSNQTLYIAITSTFIKRHVGQFPQNSIVFLNGCSVLRAPLLWQALQTQHVAAMISWDQEAPVNVTEPAAAVVIKALSAGSSVSGSIKAASDAGLAIAFTVPPANLGFLGNGDDVLTTPHGTATSTPVPPTPTTTPVPPTPTTTAMPSFNVKVLGVRFEGNNAKTNPRKPGLTTVRSGTKVRLSTYYTATGNLTGCTYTSTLTLFLGIHRIHRWTKTSACRPGSQRISIGGVKLSKRGSYTLSARIQLNARTHYTSKAHLRVK